MFDKNLLRHAEQSHVAFRVRSKFSTADHVCCILLSLQSCWKIITISHVFTVVYTVIDFFNLFLLCVKLCLEIFYIHIYKDKT